MKDARAIEEAFSDWASEHGFVEEDAVLVGDIDGARIEIDSGTRGERAFMTVVRVHEGTGAHAANLRPSDPTTEDEPPMTRALLAAIREDDAVAVLWADEEMLTVRSRCGDPEKIERAVRRVLGAMREVEAQRLRDISHQPYR